MFKNTILVLKTGCTGRVLPFYDSPLHAGLQIPFFRRKCNKAGNCYILRVVEQKKERHRVRKRDTHS